VQTTPKSSYKHTVGNDPAAAAADATTTESQSIAATSDQSNKSPQSGLKIEGLTSIKLGDGELLYAEAWLPDAEQWFVRLKKEVLWSPEEVKMYGKPLVLRRETCNYGEDYDYNVNAKPAVEWDGPVLELKKMLEEATGRVFTQCACNLYPDGETGIGLHHDKRHPLLVASISFGAVRTMGFAPKGGKLDKSLPMVPLASGSLLLFSNAVNENYKHAIVEDKSVRGPQISVTFREFASDTQPDLTRDTRRELELTPGEVHAAYLELNGQITLKLDGYVERAVKAKDELEAMLPLVDQMQSMLSQRGSQRKLMTTLGLPTWSEWFEDFRKRLHEEITIRQIQRRLRAYREVPPAKDVNVVAKESIRQLESKRQSEKLEAAVEERKQLNPTICQDLIRALEAHAQKLLALAAKLRKGFRPLPVAKTGKAHQRLVREHRAKLPDPLLEEKRKLAADFKYARVEQISYDTAKNVILPNEYLGSMGSSSDCFGLYFGDHLGSVACFGSVGGTKVAASVCGPEHANKVTVLVRGATEPWAHPHSASYLIAKACDMMAAKGKPIIVAYSDPSGGEVGQIYSACNFYYTGMTKGTEAFITPDGKKHNSRQVHGLTRDRRHGELKYKRTRAEQRRLLIEQGCEFERTGGKHRFVLISGDRRTKRLLRKALKWKVLPHPRREARATAASALPPVATRLSERLPEVSARLHDATALAKRPVQDVALLDGELSLHDCSVDDVFNSVKRSRLWKLDDGSAFG